MRCSARSWVGKLGWRGSRRIRVRKAGRAAGGRRCGASRAAVEGAAWLRDRWGKRVADVEAPLWRRVLRFGEPFGALLFGFPCTLMPECRAARNAEALGGGQPISPLPTDAVD